jgi:uncharacterized membrane protein YhfC
MILLPLIAGYFIARKFQLSFKEFRRLFQAGALTFVASQVLHIPLLQGLTYAFNKGILPSPPESITPIFNAVVLGLLAGLFEETARLILFKRFLQTSRTWNDAITIGVGHGGIEAILLGILSISTLINMIALRNADLSTLGLPAEQLPLIQQQVTTFWATPGYMPFVALLERITAITLHVSLSVMVMYSVVKKESKWFWIALLYHALIDAIAVYLSPTAQNSLWGIAGLEFTIAVLCAIALFVTFKLRTMFSET